NKRKLHKRTIKAIVIAQMHGVTGLAASITVSLRICLERRVLPAYPLHYTHKDRSYRGIFNRAIIAAIRATKRSITRILCWRYRAIGVLFASGMRTNLSIFI